MNPFATLFLLVNVFALLSLPRRWAALPLLVSVCYMTRGQGVEVGVFSFPIIRIIIGFSILRVLVRGERLDGELTTLDKVMLAWGIWALCSSAFHEVPENALVFRSGLVYDVLGVYFLVRIFCKTTEDFMALAKVIAFLLAPVALEMIQEHITGRNLFAVFGGVRESPAVRNDKLRAQGPFAHAILAGTVGAVCLPLMVGLWRQHRTTAYVGLGACLLMILTCNSSGPILSMLAGVAALAFWRWRHLTREVRIAALIGYVLLDIIMKAPPYYLIARIDLTGGSTGWHRAHLIESSIDHLGEWWFAGTDHTRHWMPTGVTWSPEHTDFTNHYLRMGVIGGLPLMTLFIASMWIAFVYVGRTLRSPLSFHPQDQFFLWCLASSLFAHAATCISVSYFDQSFVFLYLNIAAVGSLYSSDGCGQMERPFSPEAAKMPEDSLAVASARFGKVA